MSNIDKQALREVAERAESDSWGYDRDEFNEALTPSTVLALLDELEAKEKHIAELEARTVTVSLPDVMPPEAAPAHYWGSGESMAYADGYNKSTADLKASFAQACSSAGVNVEFE